MRRFAQMIRLPELMGTLHSQFLLAHEVVNVLGSSVLPWWVRYDLLADHAAHEGGWIRRSLSLRALYLTCGGLR